MMKTQDLGYARMMWAVDWKKVEQLEVSMHLLGGNSVVEGEDGEGEGGGSSQYLLRVRSRHIILTWQSTLGLFRRRRG